MIRFIITFMIFGGLILATSLIDQIERPVYTSLIIILASAFIAYITRPEDKV